MTCPHVVHCHDGGAEAGALLVLAMVAIFVIAGVVYGVRRLVQR